MVMSELKKEGGEFPQKGDTYYYINGCVDNDYFDNDNIDSNRIKTGNFYKEVEEANKQVKKLRAIVRVKTYIKDNFGYDSEDWADWGDDNEKKYYISFSYCLGGIRFYYHYAYDIKVQSFIGHIKTEDECKILIKNCKEDLELICK